TTVARRQPVDFSGTIAGDRACTASQDVRILARPNAESRFHPVGGTVTGDDGRYAITVIPPRTFEYIAVAPATPTCDEATSPSVVVVSG
ncbi:MAG: hypothetical protein M3271_04030, partial [Actinomycetota bacterium]|nr:hypothetical protein [Actinomycetota bacterium]